MSQKHSIQVKARTLTDTRPNIGCIHAQAVLIWEAEVNHEQILLLLTRSGLQQIQNSLVILTPHTNGVFSFKGEKGGDIIL
jgi:hypothetical protein